MAKFQKRLLARQIRKEGKSIKDITKFLDVSKSSASLWCRDIKLTPSQIENLHRKIVTGGYKGRLKGAQLQKERRENKIAEYQKSGFDKIRNMNKRDLLILGLGLYLGEGNKKGNKFQFTNSNPDLIKIILIWLDKIFNVEKENLIFNIIINQIHEYRKTVIKNYWTKIVEVNNPYFNKTVFIKTKNKKIYQNPNNYFGTLTIRVRKSSNLQYKILGLCYGISVKTIRLDSSTG